jgi:hypothetical protein
VAGHPHAGGLDDPQVGVPTLPSDGPVTEEGP